VPDLLCHVAIDADRVLPDLRVRRDGPVGDHVFSTLSMG
jgi:hypothetical protein